MTLAIIKLMQWTAMLVLLLVFIVFAKKIIGRRK